MSAQPQTAGVRATALGPFAHVLVGVDSSPESREAARQAARLVDRDGVLALLAAWRLPPPPAVVPVGTADVHAPGERVLLQDARRLVGEIARSLGAPARAIGEKVAEGDAADRLVREAVGSGATLIAVGSHGLGRWRGILAGSTATAVVHRAPCSVLVARPADQRFPTRIVVGVDGSPGSAEAFAAAAALAARTGAELRPVVAGGRDDVERDAVDAILSGYREELRDDPVTALLAAGAEADLVVVGSRGLRGLRALGSVSEQVAHRARCSVLVVR